MKNKIIVKNRLFEFFIWFTFILLAGVLANIILISYYGVL